jgi:sugar/nucleoside kinase (ribokinase family)
MKVLVVGSITRDTIVDARADPESIVLKPGGTSFYASCAYARLGATVSVLSRIAAADDAWIRKELPDGMDARFQPSPVTTSFENRYEGEDRAQRVGALAPPIEVDDDLVRFVDWIHLGPLHPTDLAPDWYRIASVPLALDVQGVVRHVDHGRIVPRAVPDLADRLRGLRWLKAGHDEWRLVLDAWRCTEREAVARLRGVEVLRTEGRHGGALLCAERTSSRWAPSPLVTRVDPTGAGDVFFAAYLAHRAGLALDSPDAARAAARFVSEFLLGRSP